DRALADDGAFIDSGVTADQDFVLDDDGQLSHRLENSADLRPRRDVNAAADLRARTDEDVRIEESSFPDPCADVHVRRRHDRDSRPDVTAVADRGAARHDPQARLDHELLQWKRVPVEERKSGGDRLAHQSDAKAEKNSFLDPGP